MKPSTLLAFTGLAAANPVARQLGSSTRDDLEKGTSDDCPGVIFIFARASGETGNIVSLSLTSRLAPRFSKSTPQLEPVY